MILDSHCVVGFWPLDRRDLSCQALLRLMDRHDVAQACIVSTKAFLYDFVEGNEETLKWCRSEGRFLPVATIDPRRYVECVDEIASARERGFRLFRLFPDRQGWQADAPAFRRLVPAFAEAGLPLAVPPEIGLGALAACLPELRVPVILSAVSYWQLADALAMMEQHENVRMDTALLNSPGAIEQVCELFGPGRLLFGSGALLNHMAPALRTVEHAQIRDRQKRLIVAENLRKLLGSS